MRWIVLIFLALPSAKAEDCARCHIRQTENFAKSGMAQAMHPKGNQEPHKAHVGNYDYELTESTYKVTNGKKTLEFPIIWTLGHGSVGETYMFQQQDGKWRESRVSYFPQIHALDLTMGAQNITPHNIDDAAGRLLPAAEASKCLGCHSTNSEPGIQCARCHGPAEDHLKKRKLASLSTQEQLDFCGQCHRTWDDIAANGPHDIQNVRFQPYRLTSSKCYDAVDARIRCTGCHDPHQPLAANYDSKCQACHSPKSKNTTANRHICKVGTRDCATCHMPRLDLPGSHATFADHRIRIVHKNEVYPN